MWCRILLALGLAGCAGSAQLPDATGWANPQPVTIEGYTGSAEEPRFSPDGQYLVFDDRTDANPASRIYCARRVDDLHWQFMGEVGGANAPGFNEAAGFDNSDPPHLYFMRGPQPPDHNGAWRGTWHDGILAQVAPVPGLGSGSNEPSVLNGIDAVGHDGVIYLVRLDTRTQPPKSTASVALPASQADFARNFVAIYSNLQPGILTGAPKPISRDGLTAFFTRDGPGGQAHILVARRASTAEPFGAPQIITAADGFVEGQTLSPDETKLYYHKAVPLPGGGFGFAIYVLTRVP